MTSAIYCSAPGTFDWSPEPPSSPKSGGVLCGIDPGQFALADWPFFISGMIHASELPSVRVNPGPYVRVDSGGWSTCYVAGGSPSSLPWENREES